MTRYEDGRMECDLKACGKTMDYKDIYADSLQPNPNGNLCIDCRLKMSALLRRIEAIQ